MVSASPTTVTAARTHDARLGLVTQDTMDWMPEALQMALPAVVAAFLMTDPAVFAARTTREAARAAARATAALAAASSRATWGT